MDLKIGARYQVIVDGAIREVQVLRRGHAGQGYAARDLKSRRFIYLDHTTRIVSLTASAEPLKRRSDWATTAHGRRAWETRRRVERERVTAAAEARDVDDHRSANAPGFQSRGRGNSR